MWLFAKLGTIIPNSFGFNQNFLVKAAKSGKGNESGEFERGDPICSLRQHEIDVEQEEAKIKVNKSLIRCKCPKCTCFELCEINITYRFERNMREFSNLQNGRHVKSIFSY
ncbi:hypothetical protein KC19_10G147300 [Ceratodon purpureus]|uniref:Uncharacterized protein n=1 Tax=Ceratodon purpureus TaxID=3225 RepID=A0A8T0GLZ5_CERPU|nr:hypothetical protein KC19_10G147300 [Ceratodon purpureus]